jgi:hypothetical protein
VNIDDQDVIIVKDTDNEDIEIYDGVDKVLLTVDGYPETYDEALREDKNCKEAIQKENESFIKNETWKLVERPRNRKVFKGRWVFVKKFYSDGNWNVIRHVGWPKDTQIKGIDYVNVFAPTARNTTLRIILTVIIQWGFYSGHFDVKQHR